MSQRAASPLDTALDLLRSARSAPDAAACIARIGEVHRLLLRDGKVDAGYAQVVEPLFALAGERGDAAVRAAVVKACREALVVGRGSQGLGQGMAWVPSDRLAPTPAGLAVAQALRAHGPSLPRMLADRWAPLRADEVSLCGLLGLELPSVPGLLDRLLRETDRHLLAATMVALATLPLDFAPSLRHTMRWFASGDPEPLVRVCALACRRVLDEALTADENAALLDGLRMARLDPDVFPPCGGSVARTALEAVLMWGFDPATWPDLFARIGARAGALPAEELDAERALVASAVLGVDPVERVDPKPGSLSEPARKLVAELADKHPAVLKRLGLERLAVSPTRGA
jgi:hypothetical protein